MLELSYLGKIILVSICSNMALTSIGLVGPMRDISRLMVLEIFPIL